MSQALDKTGYILSTRCTPINFHVKLFNFPLVKILRQGDRVIGVKFMGDSGTPMVHGLRWSTARPVVSVLRRSSVLQNNPSRTDLSNF